MPTPRKWHDLIRSALGECVETWEMQARLGPVTPKARAAIVTRTVVLLTQRLEGHPPDIVVTLLPGLLQTMLEEMLEVKAGRRRC